jgi:hypothetical protein
MAGFVAIGNNEYIGTCTSGMTLENGMLVTVNWTTGVASTPTATSDKVFFVENVIDTVDEQQINDIDFTITSGQYLRLKRLLPGEVFVSSKVTGTPSVGDSVDCGTTGTLTATSGSPNQTFAVIEKPTLWGTTVYKCVVLS